MIRIATRYDIPRLLEIVEAYAYETPIEALGRQKNHNPKHVERATFWHVELHAASFDFSR